ncbi:hypothetical protein V5799_032514 [Amblyomma americanum]|uniref:Uncharacterized protein n=1 Tax=Amblyomma americanum TaxID=6943 RepID=A0AAQ4DQY7_AMBAM
MVRRHTRYQGQSERQRLDRRQSLNHERELNDALKKENAALRATINNLTKESANIRNAVCTVEQQRSSQSGHSKAEVTTTDTDKKPSPKKRAVELRNAKNNVSSCRVGSTNTNVEAKLNSLENMIQSMKEVTEAFQTENVNRLNNLERSVQLILSYPTLAPLQ